MVDLESLVPQGHRLRKIDAALDLSFVRDAVRSCYTEDRGRPSVDPELAVRMMILGVLYDLSDRQLCDELCMHAGFRWFCRLNFHDPVPDHSCLSRLRNERWAQSELFTQLFEQVLGQCAELGMIGGRHASVDGTQIAANASMKSMEAVEDQEDDSPDEPAEPQGEGEWQGHGERYSNQTHRSQSDGDARLYRKGKQRGAKLSYLVHDLIDTKSRVILGRRASLATGTAERESALALLDEHEARREALGVKQAVEVLSGDAGYGASEFVADVLDRDILPHVPLQANPEMEAVPTWQRRTFDLTRYRKRCENVRQAKARNRVREAQRTHGYTVSRKLRVRSEHIFAEAKNEHGLGRARHRSLARVDRHSLLIAAVQNLKRLACTRWRRAHSGMAHSSYFAAFWHVFRPARARERTIEASYGFQEEIAPRWTSIHLQLFQRKKTMTFSTAF